MRWGYGHKLGPFELWDAIGFLEVVTRLEMERRALPSQHQRGARARHHRALPATGAASAARRPSISIFVPTATSPSNPRPGILTLRDRKRTHGVVFRKLGRVAGRPGRRRSMRRIPQQAEHAGRRQHRHGARGPGGNESQLRRDGHRQRRRDIQRGRQPDAGAAGRARGRMGRAESRRPAIPANEHGAEIRGQAGGRRAILSRARRRLRTGAALHARASLGRNLHRIGGSGSRA